MPSIINAIAYDHIPACLPALSTSPNELYFFERREEVKIKLYQAEKAQREGKHTNEF